MAKARRAAGFVVYRNFENSVQFLLVQASKRKHHWSPPKGHVEYGEDDLTTAFRETLEESGISKDQLFVHRELKDVLHYKARGADKVVVYWPAQLLNPQTTVTISHEHQDFKWLELEDACRTAGFPDLQKTIRKFHEFISNMKSERK